MTETDFRPGDAAPAFGLEADSGETVSLHSMRGRKLIVYFYPKDSTSGCTTQACAFRDSIYDFANAGYTVLGISRDSRASHRRFKERNQLNFALLSDREEAACAAYGVLKEKTMCGRKYIGIERSVFVIDEQGNFTHILRNVSAKTIVGELAKLLAESDSAAAA